MTYSYSRTSSSPTIVYTGDPIPRSFSRSIFLAGPTPRDPKTKSWRPEALRILREMGYDGVVFDPESKDGKPLKSYDTQVGWELEALNSSDIILFWLDRDIKGGMPAFTTNDEWGTWKHSGKVVLGTPTTADKVQYQEWWADHLGVPQAHTLKAALTLAIGRIEKAAFREGGETKVPLDIWNREDFQSWYQAHKAVGNTLEDANVQWAFRVGKKREVVFLYSLQVNVRIAAEDRNKTNEVVVFRPDIAAAVLHCDGKVALIKEFRSPVRNPECFVYELPGGSGEAESPKHLAQKEVEEEMGLSLPLDRFIPVSSRQLMSTLASHQCHLFSVPLSKDEMDKLEADTGVHGVEDSTEKTYIKVMAVDEIRKGRLVDWSNLGMILDSLP